LSEESRTKATIGSRIKGLAGKLIETGTRLNAVGLARRISDELGLSEKWFNYTHIELRNKLNEEAVKQVPFTERVLFLPHCLKKPLGCKTAASDEGVQCFYQKGVCDDCLVQKLRMHALGLGYTKTFIAPGGSMVHKLIAQYKPKAVIGIACYNELTMAMDACMKIGLPCQGVLLLKAGCNNTEASPEEALEKIDLIKEELRQKAVNESITEKQDTELIERLK